MRTWDNMQALAEGWDLFDVDGRWQLQRIDWPEGHECLNYDELKFQSDAHAIVQVSLWAYAGSKYHWDALHLIGALVEY